MAIEVFSLYSTLGLDSSGFESGLEKAKKGLTALGDATKLVVGAVGAVATALGAVGAKALSEASQYETAFAKVQTIMDSTQISADELSSGILNLSSSLGVASEDIADTVYNAISATGDTANALALTESASKLAIGGFTDTTSALGVLTTAMNAYGLSAEQAEHISDSLITVQNLGVTTVGELAGVMGRAIASASAYGVDLENLEAGYIAMTKAGISATESTTYISSMLSELGDSGSTVAKILQEQTGKGFSELMAEGYSLGDVLQILSDSVDGNSTALINLWGTQQAGKASNAIISQSISAFNDNLQTLKETTGTTESAYSIMADTVEQKTKILKTAGQNLLISLGQGIQGQAGILLDVGMVSINKLVEGLETGGLVGMAKAGGTVIADLVNTIVDLAPTLIDTAIIVLQSFIDGINDNLDRILVGAGNIFATLIQGVLSMLPQLYDVAYNIIVSLSNYLVSAITKLIGDFPNIIGFIIQHLVQFLSDMAVLGTSIISKLLKGIKDAIPTFLNNLPNLAQNIASAWGNAFGTIFALGKELISQLWEGIKSAWNKLKQIGGWLFDFLFGNSEEAVATISTNWKGIAESVSNSFVQGFEDAEKRVEELMSKDISAPNLDTVNDSIIEISNNINEIEPKDISITVDTSGATQGTRKLEIEIGSVRSSVDDLENSLQYLMNGNFDMSAFDDAYDKIMSLQRDVSTISFGEDVDTSELEDSYLRIMAMLDSIEQFKATSGDVDTSEWDEIYNRLNSLRQTIEEISPSVLYLGLDNTKAKEALDEFGNAMQETGDNFEEVVEEMQSDWDKWVEGFRVSIIDIAELGTSAFENLMDSFFTLGESLVTGQDAWTDWGLSALEIFVDILKNLGSILASLAIQKALMEDWGGFALATAGSISAFTASGVLSGVVSNIRNQRESEKEEQESISKSSSYEEGYDAGYEEGKKSMTIIQNIESVPLSAYELEQQAYVMADKLRWA